MAEVLVVLLIMFLVGVGVVVAVAAALVHSLVVRNRVVAGRRSPAPLTWLVALDHAARLHRRLRDAISMATTASGPSANALGLDEVVGQLCARASDLDDQLVFASRMPKARRRRMLRELQAEVIEVERLAERTVRMSTAWRGHDPAERGLSDVRERLELLESAIRELDGIESGIPTTPAPHLPTA